MPNPAQQKKINSVLKGVILCLLLGTMVSFRAPAQHLDSVITEAGVQEIIGALANDSMMGRGNYQAGLGKAANYIAAHFASLGLQTLDTAVDYKIPFAKKGRRSRSLINVVGVLPGNTRRDEWVIIAAHYDHLGVQGKRNDTVYNGANDNASGTTAVLKLAEYFAKQGNNARTLVFCCFAGEELGLLGSYAFARSIIDPGKVKAVLNIEMIGRHEKDFRNSAFVTGSRLSDLFTILNASLEGTGLRLFPDQEFSSGKEEGQLLFYRSDNLPFAYKGIPAHSIMSSTDRDAYYHKKQDELSNIDLPHLATVIKTIALAMRSLVDGTATPGRIDPSILEKVEFRH